METIKANPALGTLVKSLNLTRVDRNDDTELQNFFDFLTTYCSQVCEFSPTVNNAQYWINLSTASLPRLQRLDPNPYLDINLYCNAALNFCKTLLNIHLIDLNVVLSSRSIQNNLTDIVYPLSEVLEEFEEVEDLTIQQYNSNGLAGFDSLIDKCPKLRNIVAYVITGSNLSLYDETELQAYQQRPCFKSFTGLSSILYNNNSLLYLMRKFPSLDQLNLTQRKTYGNQNTIAPVTSMTLNMFLIYLQNIPRFIGKINVTGANPDLLMNVIRTNNRHMNTMILTYNNGVTINSAQFTDGSIRIDYQANVFYEINSMPHWYLIQEVGHLLVDLTLLNFEKLKVRPCLVYEGWLQNILDNCTMLKKLKISRPMQFSFDDEIINTHHNLETLTIVHYNDVSIFGPLSRLLPGLKTLSLIHSIGDNRGEIVLNMKSTSFDLLRIDQNSYNPVYIKISTASGQEFYFLISRTSCQNSTKILHERVSHERVSNPKQQIKILNISCTSLRKLQLYGDHIYDVNAV